MKSNGPFMGPQTLPSFITMIQNKTGAFLSMGRLPQLFGHAVLAAGVLAGGASILYAGGAMAETSISPIPCSAFAPDTTVGHFTIAPIVSDGPTIGTGNCSISSPVAGSSDVVTMDVKFVPELVGPIGAGTYSYSLTSSSGPFIAGLVDSDFDFGTGTVQKQVYASLADLNNGGPTIFDNTSTSGSPSGLLPLSNTSLSTIYVKDTYTVDAGGQIDNFTNTFQTPGPLPILGAGAAFGFSRKLRGRIKAARLG
jgi:hypothetical protein